MSTPVGSTSLPARPAPAAAPVGACGQRRTSRRPPPGPAAPAPSREAKQRAAAILEVLAGARTPADAARALGVSLPRYYLLEEQALGGLLTACEPQPRGPRLDAARRCQALERECERWRRECSRQQALVRAAQRGIGLPAPAAPPLKPVGAKSRKRRTTVRALRAVARLRADEEPPSQERSTAAPAPS
jgi:hypothetical protein